MLSLIVAASFYEQDCTSEDVTARPHARVELTYLVAKGIITIFFSLFEHPKYHYYQVAVVLSVGISITYLYIKYLPYYHYTTTVIQSQFMAVFTWCGVCLLIANIGENPDDAGPITLFYVGGISVWIMAKAGCDWRRQQLCEKSLSQIQNPYEVELHARFKLLQFNQSYKVKDDDILQQIEEFYYEAERRFPGDSIVKIFVAQFLMTYRNRYEAVPKLDQANQLQPKLDEQFIIYKSRQNVGKDAITVVTFNSYLDSAHRAEIIALQALLRLWKQLKKQTNEPNLDQLTRLAKTITQQIHTASIYYKSLMGIDPTHTKMLPMHIYFLEDVMHRDDKNLRNLKNRFQDIKSGAQQLLHTAPYEPELNTEPPYLIVSSEKQSLGIIEKASKKIFNYLKLPKTKIINNHASTLMANYYQDHFEELLYQIFEKFMPDQQYEDSNAAFIDRDGYLCRCEFVITTHASSNNHSRRPSSNIKSETTPVSPNVEDYSLNPTSNQMLRRGTISVGTRRPSFLGSEGLLRKTLRIQINIIHDQQAVLVVSQDFRILEINKLAGKLFRFTPDTKSTRYIDNYIRGFDQLLDKSQLKYQQKNNGRHGFDTVQTFTLVGKDEIVRIRMNFQSVNVSNNMILLVFIDEFNQYSNSTKKFLSYFITYLEGFLFRRAPIHGQSKSFSILSMYESSQDANQKVINLIARTHKKIEAKNSVFSPELVKLKWIFLIVILMTWALFVASYGFSGTVYNGYTTQLNYISKFTDIQSQSSQITMNVLALDAARRNFKLPNSISSYYDSLVQLIDSCETLVDDVKENSNLDEMSVKNVIIVYQDPNKGFDYRYENSIDAVLQQVVNAQILSELQLDDFNIENNHFAFWVFENGRAGISNALDKIANLLMEEADDSLSINSVFQYIFAAIEIAIIITLVIMSFPLLYQSEKVHAEVVNVFCNLQKNILQYLHDTTENKLRMRQDVQYPECKDIFKTDAEIWEDYLKTNIKSMNSQQQGMDINIQKTGKHKINPNKIRMMLKNGLMKRVLIYSLFVIGIIISLQVGLGQIIAVNAINNGSELVKHAGHLGVLINRIPVYILSCFLANYHDQVTETQQKIDSILGPDIYNIITVEYSYYRATNITEDLHKYAQMFLIGNEKTSISYDDIYEIQTKSLFSDYFEESCNIVNHPECETFYGRLITRGTYNAINGAYFDTNYLVNEVIQMPVNTTQALRWTTHEDLLEDQLKLYNELLIPFYAKYEAAVLSYFKDVEEYYNTIRKLVLSSIFVFSFIYYVFVFRPSLMYQEKKKRLTRNMLTLLPTKIVANSVSLQKALRKMTLDQINGNCLMGSSRLGQFLGVCQRSIWDVQCFYCSSSFPKIYC